VTTRGVPEFLHHLGIDLQHDRVRIRDVVVVVVWIEEQVGRVQDEDTAPSADKRTGDVQPVDELWIAVSIFFSGSAEFPEFSD